MEIGLNEKLKTYHWAVPILTIPIFLLVAGYNALIFYATTSGQSGLWGNMYSYYDLSKWQFSSFKLVTFLALIVLIIFQIKYLIEKNAKRLNKTFLIMLIIIGLWFISEIYLQTKFIGKG